MPKIAHQENAERDAYSKAEIAERLGLSPFTVHRKIMTGQIRAIRVGGRVLVPAAELSRILEHGTAPLSISHAGSPVAGAR